MSADRVQLIEREEDLASIRAMADQAAHGPGRLVLVDAAAGLGKSRMLAEVATQLREAGYRTFTATGTEQESAHAFGVVRQLFDKGLADQVVRQVALAGAASVAGVLFPQGADESERPGDVQPAQALHALFWMVTNLAQSGPVALVVDDAHEADEASVGFLGYLTRRLVDLPALVVVASRPRGQVGPRPSLDALRDLADVLTLAPLSEAGTAELISAAMGQPCEPAFSRACHAGTGGNPFYLRTLAQEALRHQIAPTRANVAWAGELGPPVILRAMLFRLGGMIAGATQLARAAAILGHGAGLRLTADLAGVDVGAAAAAADALVAGGVLEAGQSLTFVHPIVRSAVLTDLGAHTRAAMHGQAARLLHAAGAEPHAVATHLLHSDPAGDTEAVAVLRAAARSAMREGSPVVATSLLCRALAEPPASAQLPDVLDELGRAEAACGNPDALNHLLASIDQTADALVRGERALLLADFAAKAGAVPAAVDVIDAALAALPDDGSDLVVALHLERYWDAHINLATVDRVGDGRERLRAALGRDDDELRRRAAAYLAMDAALLDDRPTAIDYAGQALAPPGLVTFCPADTTAVPLLLLALSTIEQHDDFAQLADDAAGSAAREGNLLAFLLVSTFRTVEALSLGRLNDVAAESETIATAAAREGWSHGTPGQIAVLVEALIEGGRIADAQSAFADAAHFPCDDPTEMPTALLLNARGRLRIASGDVTAGLADLLTCGDRMERLRVHSPGMIDWRAHAALACLRLDERDQAVELATRNHELAERLCGPARRAEALRVLARTTKGDEAIELLAQAAKLVGSSPALLERARVLTEFGTMLRRRGNITAARDHLAGGLEAAVMSGAAPIAAFARDELRAAGARPRRPHRTGADALTPAESRVARLAAEGTTNTAIAQALFLSRKTVEKHLANSYRKLGIDSRAQLTRALNPSAPPGVEAGAT